MAKYKKKYYTKKKVLKAIAKYQRRKLNYVTDVYYDADGKLFIDGEETNSFIVGSALTGNINEYQTLGKQFGFVRLRAILIEVNPDYISAGYDYGICIGQTNDTIAFGNLRTQPNILLIDTKNKSRMYLKINSEFTSTNDIQLFNNVALLPFRQGSGAATRYSLKITLYLTFKTSL